MKFYGLLAILVFFSSSIHAANCIPKVTDKKVTVEYFDGNGNLVRSEAHKVRSKTKYKGLVSNEKAFKKLKKDKTGNIKIRSGKLDIKSGGMTTKVSKIDGTSLARIGGCPVSKLKFYKRIGKEKPPFIHMSLIEAASKVEVQPTSNKTSISSTKSPQPIGEAQLKDAIKSSSISKEAVVANQSREVNTSEDLKISSQHEYPEITGEWSGMLHCYGVNLLFDMDIQSTSANRLSAVFRAEPKLMERKGITWHPEKINTSLQGTYNPELAIFNLKSINAPNTQAFEFVGIVEPDDQKMSAYAKSQYYSSCSYAIASKQNIKKTIKSIVRQTNFTPKRMSSKGMTRQQCDSNIQNWLNQLNTFPGNFRGDLQKYAALLLFQDQYFKPHFGESFKDISKSDMMKASFQLQSGCRSMMRSSQVRTVIPHLNIVFENNSGLSRGEVFVYPVAKDIVKTWAVWAKKTISRVSHDPNGGLDLFLKDSKKITPILWPTDTIDFALEIAKAKQRSNNKLLLADIQKQIASGDNGIQDLLALSQKSFSIGSSRGSSTTSTKESAISAEGKKQATDMISSEINEHALPAVRKFASSQKTLNNMGNLRPLASNQTLSSLNRYLSSESKKDIDSILAIRKEELLSEQAAKEEAIFRSQHSQEQRELEDLASLVVYERQLNKKYGSLLNNNAFTNFNHDRQSLRQELLVVHEDKIKSQINTTFDEKAIEDILTRYIHKQDRNTPGGKSLYSQKNTRFIEIQAVRDRNRIQDLKGMYYVSNDSIERIVQEKKAGKITYKTFIEVSSRKNIRKEALSSKGVFDTKTQRFRHQAIGYPPVAGCGDIWLPSSGDDAVWSNKFVPIIQKAEQSNVKVWKRSDVGGGPGKACKFYETSKSSCKALRCIEWWDDAEAKKRNAVHVVVNDLALAKKIYSKLERFSDELDRELRAANRKLLGGSQNNYDGDDQRKLWKQLTDDFVLDQW